MKNDDEEGDFLKVRSFKRCDVKEEVFGLSKGGIPSKDIREYITVPSRALL